MFSAVQFHHPILCHNATNTSVVRNVFRSAISSPTSVSQSDECICSPECFLQRNFITYFCVTIPGLWIYFCPECFPQYNFITHFCVTTPGLWISLCPECFPQYNYITYFCVAMPQIPSQSWMFSALETELPRFYGRPWPPICRFSHGV